MEEKKAIQEAFGEMSSHYVEVVDGENEVIVRLE